MKGLLLRAAILMLTVTVAVPAVAETPMNPIYRTGQPKVRAPSPSIETAPPGAGSPGEAAKISPSPLTANPRAGEIPVATAPIPPPLSAPQAATIEPGQSTESKRQSAESKSTDATPPRPQRAASRQPEARRKTKAKRPHYAHRSYRPYYAYGYRYEASNRGWGGGQFGPSPYSSGY